jgi:hypothetical protein
MSGPEGRGKEGRKPRVSLEAQEIALLKVLIEKEHCSYSIIHELTGMPVNSVHGALKANGITLPGDLGEGPFKRGNPKNAALIRARKIALLRTAYGTQLALIRKKYEAAGH